MSVTYEEFRQRLVFSKEDLLAFSYGKLVENPPSSFDARLPAPPFLMVDRVTMYPHEGRWGKIVGELDIFFDAWYFQCHFPGDPVMPGCLSLDAIWQLLGFYCVWRGALGAGRALGCGEVHFSGQVRPYSGQIRYEINVKRYASLKEAGAHIAIGDGRIYVGSDMIAEIKDARTGVFKDIAYSDYPKRSHHAMGGLLRRGS
ncbi:MAG: bifunctional 3-hydroxydecanoyl-ACP dehydratase/trans-2-decenoyl-ACP isomerase [Syntrophales bacterium]|nr:bifunctional 3-hydroxydecanoyl-ACP dehydratase/trans-2-decenoyl-ACP isomerase [Syntrophales bacterium]